MGEGRFGPLFRAHDAGGRAVVVRTFAQPLSAEQRDRLITALTALCETPLEHPSVARPVSCGIQDGQPFVVHTFLPGTTLAEFIEQFGRPTLSDIVLRITYVAGALDFAAATGVLHGALSTYDVIFSEDSAGVAGLGLVQALATAGVPGFSARRDDDVRALIELTGGLLGPEARQAHDAVAAALSGDSLPGTALEFAASLHRALAVAPVMVETPVAPMMIETPAAPAFVDPVEPPAEDVPRFADVEPALFSEQPAAAPFDAELPALNAIRELENDFDLRPVTVPPREPEVALPMAGPSLFAGIGSPVETGRSRRSKVPWVTVALVVLVLLAIAGFQRGLFDRSPAAAPPEVASTAPAPAKPDRRDSRTFTEAAVEKPSPAPSPAAEPPTPPVAAPAPAATPPQASAATPPPARTAAATNERRDVDSAEPPRTGPAAMMVDSRPAGAQVFVDGRSVGYTPIVVGGLAPGTHSVRMQAPGHQPWVTAVTLAAGARERVAASLEQQP
jgi:hypothetical protein